MIQQGVWQPLTCFLWSCLRYMVSSLEYSGHTYFVLFSIFLQTCSHSYFVLYPFFINYSKQKNLQEKISKYFPCIWSYLSLAGFLPEIHIMHVLRVLPSHVLLHLSIFLTLCSRIHHVLRSYWHYASRILFFSLRTWKILYSFSWKDLLKREKNRSGESKVMSLIMYWLHWRLNMGLVAEFWGSLL